MDVSVLTIFASAPRRAYEAGAYLFHAGDAVSHVCLVETGSISLERLQPTGQRTCFQMARDGDVLAEASVYASNYHCDARVTERAQVRRVPRAEFRRHMDADARLATAWAAHLARTVQRGRLIAEIRSFKTVADRLDAWLAEHEGLPEKGQWQSLAHELAVSREALYRELAKRRL